MISQTIDGIELKLLRHAICETEMGVAGFVDVEIGGRRVEIVAFYDNAYAQDDEHPASYTERVRVDGVWLPEEEPEVQTHLPFPIPGMHPEDTLAAEDLFCSIARHLGFKQPANGQDAASRRDGNS